MAMTLHNGIYMTFYNYAKGFTLVEVIVSMAVLAMLAVAIVIQVRNVSPDQQLENASDVLRSVVENMRTKAATGYSCCGGRVPFSYGVGFTLNQVSPSIALYANFNSTAAFDAGDAVVTTTRLSGNIKLVSCASASTTVTTGVCYIDVGSLACTTKDTLRFNSDSGVAGDVTFTLQQSETLQTTTVSINSLTKVVQ